MIWLEAYLIALLAVLLTYASLTDLKNGRISNKSILAALWAGSVCVAEYYAVFATDCLLPYAVNVLLGICTSLLLYAFGIWGAGDSKLLAAVILLFPARLYCLGNRSLASCFLLIAIIFIISFLYVAAETVIIGIRQKNLFKLSKLSFHWESWMKGFLFFFLMLNLLNSLISLVLPDSVLNDIVLLTSIHFVLILIGMRLAERVNWIIVLLLGIVWGLMLLFGFARFDLSHINWLSYLIVAVLMLFRLIADKYNYKTIPVSDLKPGMILSVGSVLLFAGSKVAGLPSYTREDLKTRLTAAETDSIRQWSMTSGGKKEITIVRKIPFAVFIAIGTVLFALLEVLTI